MSGPNANELFRRAGRGATWFLAVAIAVASAAPSRAVAAPPASSPEMPPEGALGRFAVGVYLLESGRADLAIEPLEEAWRASRHAPAVGARLADAYYAVRDINRAELVADDVLATDPTREDVLQLKARVCYARRDVPAAIAYLERARKDGPASFETERMLGSLYADAGQTDDAIEALRHCIRMEPSIAHLHALLGDLLVVKNDTRDAEAEYRAALDLDPGHLRAMQSLIELLDAEGRLADAIPILESYANRTDAPEATVLKLAQAYMEVGRAADGITLLEKRDKADPLSTEGRILLGRLYYEEHRYPDAIGVFDPMYQHGGKSPELARILGELYLKTNDPARARTYYEDAIRSEPEDYRNYLALFFAQSPEIAGDGPHIEMSAADASGLLDKAMARVPSDDADANFTLGMAFSSVDSLESARRFLGRANELRPGDRSTVFNLAAVNEKRGDFAGAETLLAGLHESLPDDAAVCNFYGYILAEMKKDLGHAEELVKHALSQEPENGFFIDSLGWVYYQRGEYQSAVDELERAIRIVGQDPVILEHLGDAYSALARYRDALAAYQQSDSLQDGNRKLREKIESTERRVQ